MSPPPGPLASAHLPERLLARLGFVRIHRYTDRLAITESLAARLDAANAAVDAQRERIAEYNEEIDTLAHKLNGANRCVGEQIARIDELSDENTELRGELAASEEERDLERSAREALERPLPPALFTELHQALLRDRAESQHDLIEAVAALASDTVLALSAQAVSPGITEADRLHTAGGAFHLSTFRSRLAHACRRRNADAKS